MLCVFILCRRFYRTAPDWLRETNGDYNDHAYPPRRLAFHGLLCIAIHSVLVIDRGVCTFASKALRANAAGAAAAVIVQTHDVWPYVMEDSKGEAKAGGGLDIPVCMVSKEKGEFLEEEAGRERGGGGRETQAARFETNLSTPVRWYACRGVAWLLDLCQ